MMLFAECVSAKPLPDPRHLCGCTKSVSRQYENEGKNEGKNEGGNECENEGGDKGGGMQPNQNKVTYIIEFDW